MKFGRTQTYAALVAAVVIAYSLVAGWYWTGDAIALAVLAGLVAWRTIPKMIGPGPERVKPWENYPRSKIAHYVYVSRIRSTEAIAKRSENPFERALLNDPGWRGLSADDLRRKVLEATGAGSGGT